MGASRSRTGSADMRLVVIGDFNAFEFTDGYVDALGVIAGNFDPTMSAVCAEATCMGDLVEPNLDNQVLWLPDDERYSFIFRGSAQVLDHALTSQKLAGEISGVEYGRGNADAAVDLINDDGSAVPANLPLRSSDHDGLVVYITKDEDADGVPNDDDLCPASDLDVSVIIEGCDTSVENLLFVDGCSLADLVDEALATGGEEALEDLLEFLEGESILIDDDDEAEAIEECAEDADEDDDDDDDDDGD